MKRISRLRAQRGSILLVTLIFSFVIAIALTTYLKMASTAMVTAQRSFLANDAMNVTEAGLEQMLWTCNQASAAVNNGNSGNAVWTSNGWTTSGNDAYKTFDSSNFSLSQNATGAVKIYVQNYNSPGGIPTPVAIAKSIVTPTQSNAIVKMIQVSLAKSSYFSTGMVAKNGVTFSGNNATVDSWNSDPDHNPATAAIPYSTGVRHAYGSVATTSVTSTVNVQNANIYGYVSVATANVSDVTLGSNGVISGDFNAADGTRDDSRVATNFTESLPDATLPTSSWNTYANGAGNNHITGQGNCHLPKQVNQDWNMIDFGDGKGSVKTYCYVVDYMDLTGNASNVLTIDNINATTGYNVAIKVTGTNAGGKAVTTSGSGGIVIQPSSSLKIYTSGDIDITGDASGNGGVSNGGQPINFMIFGTGTSAGSQDVKVSGNGSLSAAVYAPNATVAIKGNGDVAGAVVGKTVDVTGNAQFHYDESLANWGGSNPFKVSSWKELINQGDRDAYLTQLNGSTSSF